MSIADAEELEEDSEVIERICTAAEQCVPGYDVKEIYEILKADFDGE